MSTQSPRPIDGTRDGRVPDLDETYVQRDYFERRSRLYRLLTDTERILAGVLLLSVFVLIIVQVFARYVLNQPLTWSEELARLLLVWCTYIAAGFVASRNTHIAVDVIAAILPRRLADALEVFAMLVVIAVSAFMIYGGITLVQLTSILPLPATGLPKAVLYAAVLVGNLIILLHMVLNTYLYLRHPDEIPGAVEKAASVEGL